MNVVLHYAKNCDQVMNLVAASLKGDDPAQNGWSSTHEPDRKMPWKVSRVLGGTAH